MNIMATFDQSPAAHRPAPATFRPLRRFFRTPKGLMLLTLLLLVAVAAPHQGLGAVAINLVTASCTAILLDAGLIWLMQGEWAFPSGALLTAFFVTMLLSVQTPAYVVACTVALAINSKYVFRNRWANVLNPAAVALVANYFLFGSGQSWWGALPDLPGVFVSMLLAAVIFIAQRINKLPMLVSFLGVYFALFTLAAFIADPTRIAEIFRMPDANAALFFGGFMLTDPPTSPTKQRDQLIYGTLVAVASVAFYLTVGALWFLPGGLLIGNLWEAGRRLLTGRRQRQARQARDTGGR